MLGERCDRPVAGERQGRAGVLGDLVVDGVVDDVLADALVAGALQVDDRGLALEVARDVLHEPLERVALDAYGQIGDELIGAHAIGPYRRR